MLKENNVTTTGPHKAKAGGQCHSESAAEAAGLRFMANLGGKPQSGVKKRPEFPRGAGPQKMKPRTGQNAIAQSGPF